MSGSDLNKARLSFSFSHFCSRQVTEVKSPKEGYTIPGGKKEGSAEDKVRLLFTAAGRKDTYGQTYVMN